MSTPVSDILNNQNEEQEKEHGDVKPKTVQSENTFKLDYKNIIFLLLSVLVTLRIPFHTLDNRLLVLGKDPLIAITIVILFYLLSFFISF